MTKVPPSLFLKRLKRRKDHRFKYFNKDIEYSRGVSINEVDNFYKNIKKVGKILFPIFTNIEIKEEFNKLGVEVNNLNWTTFEFLENLHKKKGTKKELICMCGSDPYVKGLDYLIEVFKKLPYKVHLLSPDKDLVSEMLNNSDCNNIVFHEFIDLRSQKFKEIAENCLYALDFSCSETFSTSLLNLMRVGLVPIYDTHTFPIDLQFGLRIDLINYDIEYIRNQLITFIENMTLTEYSDYSKQARDFIEKNLIWQFRKNNLSKVYLLIN